MANDFSGLSNEDLVREAVKLGLIKSPDALSGATQSLVKGMTLGAGDWVKAAGGTVGDVIADTVQGKPMAISEAFQRNLALERAKGKAFEKAYPATAIASELVGSLAMPLPGSNAATLPGRIAESAAIGAGTGGISGALNAEGGMADMAEGAIKGAAVGGGLGTVVPIAARGVGGVIAPFVNRMVRKPEDVATARLAGLLADAEITPAQAAARAKASGGSLLDADPILRGEAERIVTGGKKAGAEIERAMTERAAGRGDRLASVVNKSLKPDDYLEAEARIMGRLRTEAAPHYQKAYDEGRSINDPAINAILETPAGAAALDKAVEKMKNKMIPLGPVNAAGQMSGLSLQTLDQVKRALDDKIGEAVRAGRKSEASDLLELKGALVGKMDDVSPSYRIARETFGDEASVKEALEAGRDVFKENAMTQAVNVAKMGPLERDAFRTGAALAISERMGSKPDTGDIAGAIVGNKNLRAKLRPMFDKESEYRNFVTQFQREKGLLETERRVMQGSPTARRQALREDAKDTGIAEVALAARGGVMPFLGASYKAAKDWAAGLSPEANLAISRALLSRDPKVLQNVAAQIGLAPEVVRAMQLRMAETSNRGVAATSGLLADYMAPERRTNPGLLAQ